jgi:hypothetical protein
MSVLRNCCLAVLLLAFAGGASADESGFLKSLQGDWSGKGMIKRTISASPITVSCTFNTQAQNATLSMNGTCRGMVVVSRSVSATLRANGNQYTGTYIGPAGGRSALSGARHGNTINLAVRWAKIVNGDHNAKMTIEKIGANALRMVTLDNDLASGKQVITSEINLQRK